MTDSLKAAAFAAAAEIELKDELRPVWLLQISLTGLSALIIIILVIMSNVIAIDGPAASGKSTIAGMIAKHLKIAYISTGSLYRAVALACIRAGVSLEDVPLSFLKTLNLKFSPNSDGEYELTLNGEFPGSALRGIEVAAGASKVAAQSIVREYLLDVQRSFAGEKLIVMEGRDIGTVIFPDAKYKFFVTASPAERARRRMLQEGGEPDEEKLAEIARAIALRDEQDANRAIAPLKPAADSVIIDNTALSLEESMRAILDYIK